MYKVFFSHIPSAMLKIMNFGVLQYLDTYGKSLYLIKIYSKANYDF